jgi:hypothetical protein
MPVFTHALQQESETLKALPEPTESFPDREGFKALELGPGNTFSVQEVPDEYRLTDFALSQDSQVLALGWRSGEIELFGLRSKELMSKFNSGLGLPMAMKFNAAGNQIVVAGLKGKVGIYEIPSGDKLRRWKIKRGKRKYDIQELVLDPQGKWLAYANADNSKVLDLTTDPPEPLADLKTAGSIALSQDGSVLWTVNRKVLEGFNTSTWQQIGQWPLKSEPNKRSSVVVRTGVTPDGDPSVAVPSVDGLVLYREGQMDGESVTESGSGVAFARASGTYINFSRNLSFLDATGELLCQRSYGGRRGYAVSGDGQWLALSQSSRVDLWRMETLLSDCPAQSE